MPFTIFHLGPPFLIFSIIYRVMHHRRIEYLKKYIVFWFALFSGSVIPDLQGFVYIFINRNVKIHGFSHTLIGSIAYSIGFTLALFLIFYVINQIDDAILVKYVDLDMTEIKSIQYLRKIFFFCLIGIVVFHFTPDLTMHSDMYLLWPFSNFTFVKPYYSEEFGLLPYNYPVLVAVSKAFFKMGFFGFLIIVIPDIYFSLNQSNKNINNVV